MLYTVTQFTIDCYRLHQYVRDLQPWVKSFVTKYLPGSLVNQKHSVKSQHIEFTCTDESASSTLRIKPICSTLSSWTTYFGEILQAWSSSSSIRVQLT